MANKVEVDIDYVFGSMNQSAVSRQIKEEIRGISSTAKKETDQISQMMKKAIGAFGTMYAVSQLKRLGAELIDIRGQVQQLHIAFETMLGSKEKADKIIAKSFLLGQKSPFTFLDVTTNTKQLMAMGIEYENVMDTIKSLGDVAAGVSVPLQRIAINYGQVATLGRLQQREIRDFAMSGVPLVDELAKILGKAKSEIYDMVSAGQIGFPLVEQAFKSMSGEGGKFYNMMEKQNSSVTGQVSNLADKWQMMLNDIGKSNEDLIYGGIGGLNTLIANYEEIGKVLITLIEIYGVYKAALIVTNSIEKANSIAIYTQEASVLRSLITTEGMNAVSKKNLTVGTVEHVAAMRAEIATEMQRQTMLAVSLNKEVVSRKIVLESRIANLTAAKVEQRQAALNLVAASKMNNQEMLNAAVKARNTATTELNSAATLRNAASKDYYTKKAALDSAVRRANTIETGLNTASEQANFTWTNFLAAAKTRLTAVVARLNATLMANPLTAIAVTVAVLSVLVYKLATATSDYDRAQQDLNETL